MRVRTTAASVWLSFGLRSSSTWARASLFQWDSHWGADLLGVSSRSRCALCSALPASRCCGSLLGCRPLDACTMMQDCSVLAQPSQRTLYALTYACGVEAEMFLPRRSENGGWLIKMWFFSASCTGICALCAWERLWSLLSYVSFSISEVSD